MKSVSSHEFPLSSRICLLSPKITFLRDAILLEMDLLCNLYV